MCALQRSFGAVYIVTLTDMGGGGGSFGALWVAADSDAVGGAYCSSNERVTAHCRVLLEWGETVYLSCVHLVDIIRDCSCDTCLCRC